MSSEAITTQDVTESLKFFLSDPPGLDKLYEFDDQLFVVAKENGRRLLQPVGTGEEERHLPMTLYQETIPAGDLMVISPYSEGLSRNPPADWFHRVQRMALLAALQTIFSGILELAAEHAKADKPNVKTKKKTAEQEPGHLPAEILALITPIIDEVDDKMAGEFNKLIASYRADGKLEDFLNVFHARKQNEGRITCALISPTSHADVEARLPRKTTFKVLVKLARAIFDVDADATDLRRYFAKPLPDAHPRSSACLGVLFNVYTRLNPLLAHFSSDVMVDLGTWALHLQRMAAYTRNAVHANQPIFLSVDQPVAQKAAAGGLPPAGPVLPGTPVLPGSRPVLPAGGAPSHAVVLPGSRLPDGSVAPPTTVTPAPVMPGMAPRPALPFGGASPFGGGGSPFGRPQLPFSSNTLPASPFGVQPSTNQPATAYHPGQPNTAAKLFR